MKHQTITLGHGSGGKLSHDLIENIFLPAFTNEMLAPLSDQATIEIGSHKLAFTTDSYVVNPIFFPGGNIGDLAVYGTVNDLAMSGAVPLYLSCGFIIEVGFPISDLQIIVKTMAEAAKNANVKIVTGDTKVVECHSHQPQIFINTSGVGAIHHNMHIAPNLAKDGDVIIVSGRIGDHGMNVLSQREGFNFTLPIPSDTAPLNHLVSKIIESNCNIHVMRDITRGGLATVLNEIAQSSKCMIKLDMPEIPIHDSVRGVCDMLGLDPMFVACEGRFLVIAPQSHAESILKVMHQDDLGKEAKIIGKVVISEDHVVLGKNSFGVERIIGMLQGEQLPRIC